MIKIAIVEDEQKEIQHLSFCLKTYFDNNNSSFELSTYQTPLSFLNIFKGQFGIVFLDIEMPNCDGIEVARKIREIDNKVVLIFVTNMVGKAIEGYTVQAYDFIVKPAPMERINKVMNDVIYKMSLHRERFIDIKSDGVIKKVNVDLITYVEVYHHEVIIHIYNDKDVNSWTSLSEIEKMLPDKIFTRCNNSFIVNLNYVKEIKKEDVLVDKTLLKISRNKKKEFIAKFSKFMGE